MAKSLAGGWGRVLVFLGLTLGLSAVFWALSGSVWPAALLHATHNLWIQSVFDRLTKDAGATAYLTTEFGLGLAVAIPLTAWLCLRAWKERPARRSAAAG